jgi:hypothetical protein
LFKEELFFISRAAPDVSTAPVTLKSLKDIPMVLLDHGTDLRLRIKDAVRSVGVFAKRQIRSQKYQRDRKLARSRNISEHRASDLLA